MIIYKCKMCGGDLHPEKNATTCECEYCGSVQTIPTADNEKKMNLFARAQRLLRACEFDKAAGVYESIVADFPEEAEAYWGLVLCKYGIEYVDDPGNGKKIPTCHRSSFDSVMDDANFDQVMENSDVVARKVYRDEAKAIEELRNGIIEVSGKEQPYDIFICYKETDENGDRTLDSVLAQDIYKELIEKGYRVFFSRITLEDKLGQEYEPYIFAALNSAKVMLAVGTDYEYYNAVWVKNEWSRFLKLIASGEKKTLIPCYKGIDAYDMPKEFAHLQAQDMGKVGAMQDLIRGIEKIIQPRNKSGVEPDDVENKEKARRIDNLRTLATRAKDANDGNAAIKYYEELLMEQPNNWEANFYPSYFRCLTNKTQDTHSELIIGIEKACAAIKESIKDPNEQKKAFSRVEEDSSTVCVYAINNQYRSMLTGSMEELALYYFSEAKVNMKIAEGYDVFCDYEKAIAYYTDTISLLNRASISGEPGKQIQALMHDLKERLNIIRQKQKEEIQRKKEEYWGVHEKERKELEEEKERLFVQIKDIEESSSKKRDVLLGEMDKASLEKEIGEIKEKTIQLGQQLKSLGLFKGKEKKAIQAQIDVELKRLDEMKNRERTAKKEIQREIDALDEEAKSAIRPLKDRINAIEEELTKER